MTTKTDGRAVFFQLARTHLIGTEGTHELNGTLMVTSSNAVMSYPAEPRLLPLLALAQSRLNEVMLLPAGATFHKHRLDPRRNTAILLMDSAGAGPAAWPQMAELMAWAERVVIQPGEFDATGTTGLAETTRRVGLVLAIETKARAQQAWLDAATQHSREHRAFSMNPNGIGITQLPTVIAA